MKPQTQFSFHAYERVIERLTMEPDEVAALLDWDLAVKIGVEKGTNRIHRLFYSKEDFQCFIAIQDEKSRTIVTILPVDYFETLAYKIPKTLLDEAEQLVSDRAKPAAAVKVTPPKKDKPVHIAQTPSVFKIQATVSGFPWKPRNFNLGSWPALKCGGSIARLLQDADFAQEMQSKIKLKKRPDEYAVGLLIRLGKNGEPVWVNVEEDSEGNCNPKPGEIKIVEGLSK